MVTLFLVLQFSSLMFQIYALVKGVRSDSVVESCKGYAIWGGAITVLLGLPIQLGLFN